MVPSPEGGRPAQHDKVQAAGQEFRWEVATSNRWILDLGSATENSLSLALTYIVADADLADLTLLTGSDDSGAWWLNGQEVQRYASAAAGPRRTRTARRSPIALKRGRERPARLAVVNGGGRTDRRLRPVQWTRKGSRS